MDNCIDPTTYLTFIFLIISDLQNVNITLRILFRPVPTSLPNIYSTLGVDYDERVLPSITNEILKAVVVSYNLTFHFYICLNQHFIINLSLFNIRPNLMLVN